MVAPLIVGRRRDCTRTGESTSSFLTFIFAPCIVLRIKVLRLGFIIGGRPDDGAVAVGSWPPRLLRWRETTTREPSIYE
jgi:lipid-binding SYLF domain-containing protein